MMKSMKNLIVKIFLIALFLSTGICFGDCELKDWTRIWGSIATDTGKGVSVDSAGNIYVTGSTRSEFDGQTNTGSMDIFLTKYNSSGTKQWSRLWGSDDDDYGSGVSVDSAGNIYVAGNTEGEFDGKINAGGTDFCLTKYNSAGTKQWTRIWGSIANDYGNNVTVDSAGNIYVVGSTHGEFDGQINAGEYDLCLTKFNSSCTKQWTRIWGSTDFDSGRGVSVDSAGNVYVAGSTSSEFDGQTNAGKDDLCLTKYNSVGTKQWTRIWGSTANDYGNNVTVDSAGNIYVSGHTYGEFDGQTNVNMKTADLCLTKYNSAGTKQWTRIRGSTGNDSGRDVSVDSAGYIYVAGETRGEFDGQVNVGGYDLCLIKYNSVGSNQWTRIWGSTSHEYGRGVSVDRAGNCCVVGYTEGEFDGQTNAGSADICLTKFSFNSPFVGITNLNFSVELPTTTATIGGTNNEYIALDSTMWWENTSTSGVSGTFTADLSRSWTIDNIPLVAFENIITASGSNIFGEVSTDTITIDLVPEPFYLSFIICQLLFINLCRK